jgi:hypothetical protein
MSFESDLRTLLLAAPAVTALVSTRIAADRIEQGAIRPFIVFTRSATERSQTLNGGVESVRATFDVQCWADTRQAADAVADAVVAALVAANQVVITQDAAYDAELDLEASVLSVDWWP